MKGFPILTSVATMHLPRLVLKTLMVWMSCWNLSYPLFFSVISEPLANFFFLFSAMSKFAGPQTFAISYNFIVRRLSASV